MRGRRPRAVVSTRRVRFITVVSGSRVLEYELSLDFGIADNSMYIPFIQDPF